MHAAPTNGDAANRCGACRASDAPAKKARLQCDLCYGNHVDVHSFYKLEWSDVGAFLRLPRARPFEQRWSFAEKNDFKAADLFADVSLFQSAGLALGQGEAERLRLSLRPECHRVLEFLDREAIGKSRLAVQGYPGTGKSCLVWLWACKQALAGKHVRWYHISALGDGVAAVALQAEKKSIVSFELPKHDLVLPPKSGIDIAVLTGTQSNIRDVGAGDPWMGSAAAIVAVSSGKFVVPGPERGGVWKSVTLSEAPAAAALAAAPSLGSAECAIAEPSTAVTEPNKWNPTRSRCSADSDSDLD